jgi:amidase
MPAAPDEILEFDLVDIAAHVRRGDVNPSDLAETCRARIRDRDGTLGAVALLADPPQLGTDRGALAGVPTLLKDLQADAEGLPLRAGSRAFLERGNRGDSTLVSRLRTAGVSILGRTTTPEFGLSIVTEAELTGPTRNPWNRALSSGGSSGGSAAAVAAGLVPFAHATDSGGSTRIPAAWCGVVGFKPSRGAHPAGPHRLHDWAGLSHENAITRSVRDASTLFAVTAGPHRGEWRSPPMASERSDPLTIGVLSGRHADVEVDPEYVAAVEDVAAQLRGLGHTVVAIPSIDGVDRIGPAIAGVVAPHLAADVTALGERAIDLLEPSNREIVERGLRMTAVDLVTAITSLHALGFDLTASIADVDLVLTPTTALPAPLVGHVSTSSPASTLFAEIFRLSPFAAIFNVTGGPAVSLPWGLDQRGMPIGIQLAGHPGGDALVLEVARQLEAGAPELTRLIPPIASGLS